nr:nitroreductase family protein [uncultured Cetobacterium sp.]
MDSIFLRRSVREFVDKEVECSKLENILRAGMQAPSAWNFQPWEFLLIENQNIKDAISEISPYAHPIKNCGAAILVMCNLDRVKKDSQWWEQDLSAATQNMLLQTVEEGLAGVWIGMYPEKERVENLKKYFKLPDNIIPFSIIAIGYSDKKNEFIDKFNSEKVYFEEYNN